MPHSNSMFGFPKIAALLLLITTGAPAPAQERMHLTGADFLKACSDPTPDWIGFCHGYVQAVHDGIRAPDNDFCIPEGTPRADLVGLVVRHIGSNAELQRLTAYAVVYVVFQATYPCR
ncbi:MAG: hypothetical protein BroJett030_11480 [Alphaproteobacteria bacterium]|nr:MAG: hypothetical protein BroJett030_11480 [Alphaproteobacteria bacterium]